MPSTVAAPVTGTGAPRRDRGDACPGALTLHDAADGPLARVRLPGGAVHGSQLKALAGLGAGLELTSRGNVQIRAVADPPAAAATVAGLGLLPSAAHERVRNIVASPLAGLDGGPTVFDLVRDLDRALCARPDLADLPGRFLFAVDDGRGDVAGLGADVTLIAAGPAVWVGPFAVPRPAAVSAALTVAAAFLAERGADRAWRLDEVDAGVVLARASRALGRPIGTPPPLGPPPPRPVGPSGTAFTVLVPFGRLTPSHLDLLAGAGDLRITPWQSVVLLTPSAVDRSALAAAGFGLDADSRWYRVSACTGRPGCARALADVQADARAAADRFPGRRVRWSGCERRCGRPVDTEVDVTAVPGGRYEVSASDD